MNGKPQTPKIWGARGRQGRWRGSAVCFGGIYPTNRGSRKASLDYSTSSGVARICARWCCTNMREVVLYIWPFCGNGNWIGGRGRVFSVGGCRGSVRLHLLRFILCGCCLGFVFVFRCLCCFRPSAVMGKKMSDNFSLSRGYPTPK